MSTSGFVRKGAGPRGAYGPDGVFYDELWWDSPATPEVKIATSSASFLLKQIGWASVGGRQSCYLTSQLNAYILRGILDVPEAASVQSHVSTSRTYERCWEDQTDWGENFTGWTVRPGHTAFAIKEVTGKQPGFVLSDSKGNNLSQNSEELLAQGYVLVVSDDRHSRTAFQPEGHESEVFIFDSKYEQTTGLHPIAELPQFDTKTTLII